MIYLLYSITILFLLGIEALSKKPIFLIRWGVAVLYILLVGLRGANVGVDTAVYYNHYYTFGQFGCDYIEPGFDFLNRLCYSLGWDSWTLFTILAAMTIIPVNYTICKLERKEYTVAALLFYLTTLASLCNGMRQATVCGVFFMMAFYLSNRKLSVRSYIVYAIVIALCSLIHASAIILLFIIPLLFVSFDNRVYFIIYLLSFIVPFIDISQYLPSISLGNRDYTRYIDDLSVVSASSLGFAFTSVLNLIVFWLMCKAFSFRRHTLIANLVFLSFVLKNIGFNYPIVGRITMYFTWFIILIIAIIYYEEMKKPTIHSVKLYFLLLFMMYAVLCVHSYGSSANKLTPYTTFWENNNYSLYIKQ